MFRIQRVLQFFGLPDPLLVGGTDPDPSFDKQKQEDNLYFFCFATSLWLLSLKNDENVGYLQKVISKKSREKIFLLSVSWRSLTKREGSGSFSQMYGSTDPYQNITVPEHWLKGKLSWPMSWFNLQWTCYQMLFDHSVGTILCTFIIIRWFRYNLSPFSSAYFSSPIDFKAGPSFLTIPAESKVKGARMQDYHILWQQLHIPIVHFFLKANNMIRESKILRNLMNFHHQMAETMVSNIFY